MVHLADDMPIPKFFARVAGPMWALHWLVLSAKMEQHVLALSLACL